VFGLALLALAAATAAPGPERQALVYTRAFALPNEAVWIADVEGRRPRKLVRGWGGRLSPDGRWVAFQRCRRPRWNCGGSLPDLWLVPSGGGRARLLSRWTSALGWSPDSRRIVAQRGRLLASIEVATADLTVLDRGKFDGVSFSPDGRSVVYARAVRENLCGSRASRLYVAPLERERPRRFLTDGVYPVWGARGIAFSRLSNDCVARIWRVGPDGSHVRPILRRVPRFYEGGGVYGLRPYAWFPGGRRLLVGFRTEWGDYAAGLDVRTKAIRRLGPQVDELSRDGRFLLGTDAGAEYPYTLEILRVADGRRRVIARGRLCCADWNR
jgi:Tol biopolymer transport system component